MRRPSLSRTKGSIKDAEFIKLISIDQYEFAIEKTIIRRHSTIISTLLTDFGVGNTQEDLQILQPALTPPVSSENDTVKQQTKLPDHSVFEHDVNNSITTLSSVANRIKKKCTPLSLQRSTFRRGSEIYEKPKVYQSSMIYETLSTPSPPSSQILKGDSPSCYSYTYPQGTPSLKRNIRFSVPREYGLNNLGLAAGSHEIVNKQAPTPSPSSNSALPGLAESLDPHTQNHKGVLESSPFTWKTESEGDTSSSQSSPANNPFAVPLTSHMSRSNNIKTRPSLISMKSNASDVPKDDKIRYSKTKNKLWLSEDASTLEAWVTIMKVVNNEYTPTELLNRTSQELIEKLIKCVQKYDDCSTLNFIEEFLTDFTTCSNSLRNLLIAKRFGLPVLHGASLVKIQPHMVPTLTVEQIELIGAEDMHVILSSSQCLNLLQLLEIKRLFISPSMMTALKDSSCMAFKLRRHNQEYMTIDARNPAINCKKYLAN